MPLPLLAAIPAVIVKTAAVVAKTVATTAKVAAKAVVSGVKAAGSSLKAAGQTAVKVSKGAVSKLSSGAKSVGAKIKTKVSTSIQNRVSKFGDTQKPSIRQIRQALQDRKAEKAEVDTQTKGELQMQHGSGQTFAEMSGMDKTLAAVSNGNYQKPAPSSDPKPDVAPEAQPEARPKAKTPARKLG